MKLSHGLHLAYCTNIHRGETWEETRAALERHTMAVREQVCPGRPYAIGLRLGALAARTLLDPAERLAFRRWLEARNCYVYTINGFPYGQFHGARVKEQVFRPDWATPERVEYTQALFTILSDILPAGMAGSVSTLPGSHKELIRGPDHETGIANNLRAMAEWLAKLADRTGQDLHLGVEPEPLGYFENTPETLEFFARLGGSEAVRRCLGVNYDTCHFAVQYEDPRPALNSLTQAGIRLSKLHLSSALKLSPQPEALRRLEAFKEDIYFHQTIARMPDGSLRRHRDLPEALADADAGGAPGNEWRVHFHVPLHSAPGEGFSDTRDHLTGALDVLAENPKLCQHLEMETYTWEVLPPNLRSATVEEQLVKEYQWTIRELRSRGLG